MLIDVFFKSYIRFSVIGIFFLFVGCEKYEQLDIPVTNMPHDDVPAIYISSQENLLNEESDLTKFLLENRLNTRNISDIVYDDFSKNLYVLFRHGCLISVSQNRKFEVVVNTTGRGPGEMVDAETLKISDEGIHIFDINLNKILTFSRSGKNLRDVVLTVGVGRSFGILDDGSIVTVNYSPFESHLFFEYDSSGTLTNKLGDGRFVQSILKKVNRIPSLNIDVDNSRKNIILSSEGTGEAFIYNVERDTLVSSFSIQNGPEWDAVIEAEKKADDIGYFSKIEDIDIFPNGDIYVSWGGIYNEKRTVGMIFSNNGSFKYRIFSDGVMRNMPASVSVVDDTSMYVYSWADNYLGKININR